jgi:hypothetical protein
MSGGTEGGLNPHMTVFSVDPQAPAGTGAKRLAITLGNVIRQYEQSNGEINLTQGNQGGGDGPWVGGDFECGMYYGGGNETKISTIGGNKVLTAPLPAFAQETPAISDTTASPPDHGDHLNNENNPSPSPAIKKNPIPIPCPFPSDGNLAYRDAQSHNPHPHASGKNR